MNFFRSSTMGYYNLIIPRESAWNVMNELAELDCLHFIDPDPTQPIIGRPFSNYIKRSDDLLHKLNTIEQQITIYKKQIIKCKDVRELILYLKNTIHCRPKASHTYFEEVEEDIEKNYSFLQEQITNLANLQEKKNTLIENRAVLYKGSQILGQSFFQPKDYVAQGAVNLQGKDFEEVKAFQMNVKFNQIVGVISKQDEIRFKRTIFRVTKGNVWISICDIDEDLLQANEEIIDVKVQEKIIRVVFVVVYPGGFGSNIIQSKLKKICEAFGTANYSFPENSQEYQKSLHEIEAQLNETNNLISLTKNQVNNYLDNFSNVSTNCNCSLLEEYKLFVVREKYLYTHLNYLKMQGSIFTGQFWLPEGCEFNVEQALRNASSEQIPQGQFSLAQPTGSKPPPTYFKTNIVTTPFQEIVNTYGIPRYKEINPGLFTITTFPFLFAVMFGDIGHGFCFFMLGLYLIFQRQQIENSDSVFKFLLSARYMLVLMGFFAFYTGWIYNDFLSISINLFGSCYELKDEQWVYIEGCTYPFGLDPAWSCSLNELMYTNSYKMKLAVIIAVIHMSFGILLKGVNSIFFRNWLDFFFEFIPQLIFMLVTFGYMDFMIIFKWLHQYDPTYLAPSIITIMINMILQPSDPVDPPLWGDGVGEANLQSNLMLTAGLMVPLMLLTKPIILIYFMGHGQQAEQPVEREPLLQLQQTELIIYDTIAYQEESSIEVSKISEGEEQQKKKSEESSEIFVHQVIETIEFVLGSISNTASYLRLWALSLAHGQLSEVFFDMTLAGSIQNGGFSGYIGILIGYTIFSLATFGVLMMMDVMECFLHALRLHWVEFQNKFFKADGYKFVPYSFRLAMEQSLAGNE